MTIKNIEYSIVERAWEEGWITPRIPQYRSGMSVAVVGSGPSGTCFFVCFLKKFKYRILLRLRVDCGAAGAGCRRLSVCVCVVWHTTHFHPIQPTTTNQPTQPTEQGWRPRTA